MPDSFGSCKISDEPDTAGMISAPANSSGCTSWPPSADVAHAGTKTVSVARGEEQFDHESPKRRNDEINSKLPVPSAGQAPGPLAGIRQRDSASPRVPFSSFRRFGVSCPVFRVRGHYESRPRFRPAFRTRASRDRTEGHEDHEGAESLGHRPPRTFLGSGRSQRGRPILFGLRDRDVLLFLFASFFRAIFAALRVILRPTAASSVEVDHTQ